MRRTVPFLYALLMLAGALPAVAADWVTRPGSWLQFETSYDGEPFEGRFERFVPVLRFDPARLDDARFDVRIDLASAGTGHDERAEARRDVARFGDRFVADGELTLRGVTRPVALAFTWRAGAQPVLDGEATVPRLAFGIGTGDWADTALLPDAVKVRTHLVLQPAPESAP